MQKLKIAVNTRLLLKNRIEGIGRYSYEILNSMTKSHPEIEFHFIFDRPYDSSFIFSDNVIPHLIGPQARHPFLYYIWFHKRIPSLLKKIGAHAYFSPEGYSPLKLDIPIFVTIHDLNFLHRPQDLPSLERWYYNKFFPQYAENATKVFTVSEYSRQDLINSYNLDNSKVLLTYNGAEHLAIGTKKEVDHEYFLYVGSLHARKNIEGLLQSFEKYKSKFSNKQKLIIVGKKMFSNDIIEHLYNRMTFKDDVIFKGYVSNDELSNLYRNSLALVNLSYFEGFGIPLVEAFKNDIPVIISNKSSFPEVCGKDYPKFEPEAHEEIAEEMNKIASNESYRNELISKGMKQLDLFSWRKSSDIIINQIIKHVGA